MEKLWHPQKNSKDSSLTILKSFIHYLEVPVSRLTIQKEAEAHDEFPKLSLSALQEIMKKWGIETAAIKIDMERIAKLPSPSILVIGEEDKGKGKDRYYFVMLYEVREKEIEYLHPRMGWVIESLEEFDKKWEKLALVVTSMDAVVAEADFDVKEKMYEEKIAAHPDNKIVNIVDDFLTKEECAHVIQLASGHFDRSKVLTDKATEYYTRTSYSAVLNFPDDEVLNSIRKKASELIHMPESHFESFQVVTYAIGQEFHNHYDTFYANTAVGREHLARGGQRKYTLLAYLNDDFEGGSTHFPNLDKIVKPKQGRVLIFDNLDEAGNTYEAALHAGLPVFKGNKYAMNIWVRCEPHQKKK